MEGEPAGAAGAASKPAGRARCGSSPPPSSMEGAPPARQRALNTRDGFAAVGLDTLTFLSWHVSVLRGCVPDPASNGGVKASA